MSTYSFTAAITITVSTDVEAESLEEALRKADARSVQSLCHQCASPDYKKEWGTSGELDGFPLPSSLNAVSVDGKDGSQLAVRRARRIWRNL